MSRNSETRLNRLRDLPEIRPSPAAEAATLAAMAAAVPAAVEPRSRFGRWALAAGLLAVIGATALIVELADERPAAVPEASLASGDETEFYRLLDDASYLEQLLATMPQRQLMRVSTAGTIVGLEDRLALIDGALRRAEADGVPVGYRTALLRDRVDVMNALVTVRYVQSNAFHF